eukprot:COSAG04_NODE_3363_length_2890_cov_2.228234_2_plen_466_part_00
MITKLCATADLSLSPLTLGVWAARQPRVLRWPLLVALRQPNRLRAPAPLLPESGALSQRAAGRRGCGPRRLDRNERPRPPAGMLQRSPPFRRSRCPRQTLRWSSLTGLVSVVHDRLWARPLREVRTARRRPTPRASSRPTSGWCTSSRCECSTGRLWAAKTVADNSDGRPLLRTETSTCMLSRRSPTRPVRPQFLGARGQMSACCFSLAESSELVRRFCGDRPIRLARGVAAGVAQAGPRGGQRKPRRRAVDPADLALPAVLLDMQLQHHLLQGRLRAMVGRRLRVRCDTPDTPVTSCHRLTSASPSDRSQASSLNSAVRLPAGEVAPSYPDRSLPLGKGRGRREKTVSEMTRDALADLEPLMLQYGVDVYAAGHQHQYESMYPTKRGVPTQRDFDDPAAPVHILTGNGGPPDIDRFKGKRSAFSHTQSEAVSYTRVSRTMLRLGPGPAATLRRSSAVRNDRADR